MRAKESERRREASSEQKLDTVSDAMCLTLSNAATWNRVLPTVWYSIGTELRGIEGR